MWLVWYLFGSTSSVVLPEVSPIFVVRPCKLASNWNSCFLNFWCQQPKPNLMSFPKLQFYCFVRCFCAPLYWLRTTFLNSHRARGKSIQLVFWLFFNISEAFVTTILGGPASLPRSSHHVYTGSDRICSLVHHHVLTSAISVFGGLQNTGTVCVRALSERQGAKQQISNESPLSNPVIKQPLNTP